MERVIATLYESGKENRTNISTGSRLAYDKGIRYIIFLENLGFVRECSENGNPLYELTPAGISFWKKIA
jgi:predicted transcriptional regulator